MRNIICLIIVVFFLIPISSAYYEVQQGDIVYQDEVVDISRVLSWSGQFAYFNSGIPNSNPDKIVNFNDHGFMYAYKINKEEYLVGDWFKWDGTFERGGNSNAFTVRVGTRINYSENQTMYPGTSTPLPTPTPVPPAHILPKETHLLLARGDQGELRYGLDYSLSKGSNQSGYLWLFGSTSSILGETMEYRQNDSVNIFTFTPGLSQSLNTGWYTGYIQFVGQNGIRDVFYRPSHKIGDYNYKILDTPYDDNIIPDVPLEGFIPIRVSQEFEKLEYPSQYADDILIPITMEVVEPGVTISDYWEESDNIVIQGTTSLVEGTQIFFTIDPEQYPVKADRLQHTYNTTAVKERTTGVIEAVNAKKYIDANGTPIMMGKSNPRTYLVRIPLKWGEMSIGQHTIVASIDKYNINVIANKDFKITGEWVNPTPTKEMRKVIVSDGGTHTINRQTGEVMDSSGFPNGSVVDELAQGSWDVDINGNPIPRATRPVVTLTTPTTISTPAPTQPPNVVVTMIPVTPAPPKSAPIPTFAIIGVVILFIGGIGIYWLFRG